jgi:peptide/nickel transport system substrate-binding protein
MTRRAAQGLLAVAMLVSACGSGASGGPGAGGPGSDVLHLAYYGDQTTPDPDVFYDVEGLTTILPVYDNLIRYRQDSKDLQPDLATRWSRSDDGLSYTFTLRPGVVFDDGTPCDSRAVAAAFQRRTDVNSAPAYMLADVDHYETPDATTFIVRLRKPVSAFLDYMASSWGPKAVNPAVLTAHAGTDHAQTWLQTHSAGTGPYTLASFQRGRRYALLRNPRYFGPRPLFREVDIDIISDFSTQSQKLDRGDLDVILHAYPVAELDSAKANSALVERDFSSYLMQLLYFNPSRPAVATVAARHAIAEALDLPGVVSQVYGRLGTLATGAYPSGLLDPAAAPVRYTDDPAAARAALPGGLTLDFAYVSDESGVQRRAAEIMQQKAARAGITMTLREVQPAQTYDFVKDLAHAPDLLLATNTPDAANPDTWARILWGTGGGLNFFGYSNPAIDAALDSGLRTTDPAVQRAAYGQAGQLLAADWVLLPVANIRDWMVMRSDLTNVVHVPNYAWTLDVGRMGRG